MQELVSQVKKPSITNLTPEKSQRVSLYIKSFAAQAPMATIALILLTCYLIFYPNQPDMTLSKGFVLIAGMVAATLAAFTGGLFLLSFYQVARYQKPKSATIAIFKQCQKTVSEPRSAVLGAPLLIILMVFMYGFVQIKNGIPLVRPYSWDTYFHNLDVWMHFGKAPWEWLHPFFSQSPYLVFLLNLNYNFWFFTMWMVIIPFAFSTSNSTIRTQFFLAFFLIWTIGGGVLATWFSSVGPAFYSKLGLTPDPYAGLMSYLDQVNEIIPIWAYQLQNEMWLAYANGGLNVGISAMPSMHNATALLFVLGVRHLSKSMSIVLAVHCFLIYIGSIYLGWHYAVDAYLGWIITLAAWHISAPIARWWHRRPAIVEFTLQLQSIKK